jgi:hypothetical protein
VLPALASPYTEKEKVAVGDAPELKTSPDGDSMNPYSPEPGSIVTLTESVAEYGAPSSEARELAGKESSRYNVLKLSG